MRRLLRQFKNLPTTSKIALAILGLIVIGAIFAPWIATNHPLASGEPIQEPSGSAFFGTDAIGRDIFSRVLYGSRSSLLIGVFATLVALIAAAILGAITATSNKVISEILMRILDIIMSFPGIALAAVFVAVFGNSVPVLIFAMAFLYTPQLARVIRANILSQYGEDYVSASRVMGASTPRILLVHVARNCIAPVAVFATVLVADAIVLEASLSFINAGVEPPDPSWGNILSDGKSLVLAGVWWTTFFPGFMILITVLCLNILSEGLTDALAAPPQVDHSDFEGDDADTSTESTHTTQSALGQLSRDEARDTLDHSLATLRAAKSTAQIRPPLEGEPLITVTDLSIAFPESHGDVDIVDGISLEIRPGETLGLVGESGCGKSVTAMAIMGLLPNSAKISGTITYRGRDLLALSPQERNALRGHEIAMIYQDALSSLNPSMLIRTQLKQLIRRGGTRSAEELMELVGLDPERTLRSYPHELSGGQRQRVLIAMALTRDPKLLIADEPTTALDVTVQKQVVDLLNELREKLGFAMLFVSHDLALVSRLADRITVMYAGQVVEEAPTHELLLNPVHEYTRGLLGSVLSVEAGAKRLYQVPGTVPAPTEFVSGDRFAPRSSHPTVGLTERPTLRDVGSPGHRVALTDSLQRMIHDAR